MLLLLNNRGTTGEQPSFSTICTFSELAYSSLNYASFYSSTSYTIAHDVPSLYSELEYIIVSDIFVVQTWADLEYSIFPSSVNTYSNTKYHIFKDVYTYSELKYSIAFWVTRHSICKYHILSDIISTSYSFSNYNILFSLNKAGYENYSIINDRVASKSTNEEYDISYSSLINSTFEILNELEVEYEADYYLLTYNEIEVEHEVFYVLTDSGLLGISERYSGCWNSIISVTSEISTHLHLYNTYVSDRFSDFLRYYISSSTKNILVERELLFSERNIKFLSYDIYDSERKTRFSSYDLTFSARNTEFSSYKSYSSSITSICLQVYLGTTERHCVTRCIYSSARNIFFKYWRTSERWVGTYAKEKTVYADQRYSYAEVVLNRFESIRMIGFEVCALSYNFIINPSYTSYDIQSTISEIPLFENELVITDKIELNTVPISYSTVSNDMILIDNTNSEEIIYTSKESIGLIYFQQVLDTDTYVYDGSLVTLKDTIFVKTLFQFSYIDIYNTVDEYIEFIESVGYLKVEVGGIEMGVNDATVFDVPAFSKLPIKIYAHSSLLDLRNINIKLIWSYPYNDAVINETLLIGQIE